MSTTPDTTADTGVGTTAKAASPAVSSGGPSRDVTGKLVAAAAVLLVWQIAGTAWLPDYLPTPLGVLGQAIPTLTSASFLGSVWETVSAVVLGLLLGCVPGIVAGLLIGRVAWLRHLSTPYISGLYAMPMLAIVPMATIWFGYNDVTRVIVVALSAFLPCAVSTADGARALPGNLADVARVLNVPRRRFITDFVLPSALPFAVAGVHVAVGRALVGAAAVEFLANLDGLGTFILTNARSFAQDQAFVGVAVLALLGVLARAGTERLIRRVAPWQHAGRE
ncbi:ABC transporter permease [Streptosporangium sp. NBC_01469]|uniref:ABC transporter permease n=1 Tax=Streptosporangium sp. NBC_01469 TaxID=2903898 RepID=UPI002E2A7F66|nr:ABC transporter permease [Streptosporangium sp. NBC_01469]